MAPASDTPDADVETSLPEATVARLPVYFRGLVELADEGTTTVSSQQLAELAGVNAAKVRKDLSYLGSYGTRGVGYEVGFLVQQIGRILGSADPAPVVIVGAGNLGKALSRYGGFGASGFPVAAIVDADPAVVGRKVAGIPVRHVDDLRTVVRDEGCLVGIVATPATAAQEAVDRLVDAGVRSILNFAPTIVIAPDDVGLRKVDLATELHILGYYEHQRGATRATG
ncbi:MAG: redox-sensing transcriptional repressor Rex [Acidimicrobiales bacterium]|jgi:redox-sensing transcriptional repressor|nr:redox-sensing transcriptional repressor Rex [Acidimicrobiales bacterium]